MSLCVIEMPSVTYAQKAKIYFNSGGYKCDIIRNKESCGYSIKVSADCGTVKRMLNDKKIPYNEKGISSW